MRLPDYPENYVPRTDQVHPALQESHAKLLNIAENPKGLLLTYPILPQMLLHNLAFLGLRDFPYAHNIFRGVTVLLDMFHVESNEFQKETPILKKGMRWKAVNGPASLEAIDAHFFGGLLAGMLEANMGNLTDVDMLSFHLVMQQIEHTKGRSPKFDPYSQENIRLVVHPDEGKNHSNYPVAANKAPRDWDLKRMTDHYVKVVKPLQRELRDVFDEGRLPVPVAEAINRDDPNIPVEFATVDRVAKYNALYQVIYRGE